LPSARAGIRPALISGFFVLLTLALLASPAAGPLRYGFPVLALVFAYLVYRESKAFYAGFVVWLWMLAPLVRRIVEYRASGVASLIIASPFLACAIPFLLNMGRLGELLSPEGYPVLFAGAALVYGLGIGVIYRNPPALIATSLAFWIAPLLFAYFVLLFRTQIREIRTAIEKAFIWGAVAMGAYGLHQYLVLTPWDRLWMETAPISSIGSPEPGQVRVFSTMNSPQALAFFLVAAIFIALRSSSKIKWLAIPLATLALLLTGSRTAWFGFIVGFLYLVAYIPSRQKLQLAVLSAFSLILVLVALQGDQRQNLITRLQTLTNPTEDGSGAARLAGYAVLLPRTLNNPYGVGIGFAEDSPSSPESEGGEGLGAGDSAIIAILLSLGLPGTLFYLTGMGLAIVKSFRSRSGVDAGETLAFRALIFVAAVSAVATDVIEGGGGFLIWAALTLSFLNLPSANLAPIPSESAPHFPDSPLSPSGKPASLAPRIS